MLYVGIDWADDHHDVCITDDSAQTLASFRIPHTVEGFQSLHDKISAQKADPKEVLVALETSRGLLVYGLLQHGYPVYAINPKAVNRYKDRHILSKAKSDAVDAASLAHLLRTDRQRFKPLLPMPEDYRLLDRLCLDLRKIVEEKSRLMNQITSSLKEYYPQAVGLFSETDSPICTAFLQAFPDPDTLLACKKTRFVAFFKKQRYPRPELIDTLWQKVQAPSVKADPVVARAGRLRLLALVDQLIIVRNHLRGYEKEVKAILDTLPESKNLPTLPGIDKRLVPELTAALGPNQPDTPKRFEGAHELSTLAGCAPITQASGKWKKVRIRQACVKPLRRTFYNWAQASMIKCKWAKAYYEYRKNQKHPHATILRGLGQKWAKILFALWSSGQDYDEARHVQQLKKHNVAWAASL